MRYIDLVLDGKALRIWNEQGAGQVAIPQRQPLHTLYDAQQWVERVHHTATEHIAPLCALAGLIEPDKDALANALHKNKLIIGLGNQFGGKAVANAAAGKQWRQKQAEPAPMYTPTMQGAIAALGTDANTLLRPEHSFLAIKSGVNAAPTSTIPASNGKVTSAEDKPVWQCLIEVAGRNHFRTQQLALKGQPKSAVAASNDSKQKHRALITLPLENGNPVELQINIATQTGKPIALPLPQPVQPRQKGPPPTGELDTLLVPVRPVLYRNLQADPQHVNLPQSGNLYLFWQGKLWRELVVDTKGIPRDIDVAWEREQRTFAHKTDVPTVRKPVGQNLDAIWVPAKINGSWQTGANGFEMAFFPQPLSWDEIDQLESDAGERQQYVTALDGLQQYSTNQDFSQTEHHIGALQSAIPELNEQDNPDAISQNQQHKALSSYRPNNFAAAYIRPTTKRIAITLSDAYKGELKGRGFEDGETVILSGNKQYCGIIKNSQIQCEIDIRETRLTLEFAQNSHLKGTQAS